MFAYLKIKLLLRKDKVAIKGKMKKVFRKSLELNIFAYSQYS